MSSSVPDLGTGPLTGRTLGDFVVEHRIGEGGMGEVYLANQPVLAREAVIKTLRSGSATGTDVVQRFLREARVASSLDHPFAAHVYAFGAETDGTLWIAMERVNGSTLADLIKTGGPLPLSRLVPLVERICEVVHTAHEHGIVHRDLKPANIMVLSRAGRLLPKLLDFGIAKALAGELEPSSPTAAGSAPTMDGSLAQILSRAGVEHTGTKVQTTGRVLIGSPAYMAPEQWVDPHSADRRTDIYALGAVVYEALTGERAFTGDSVMAVARAHARQPPPRLPAGMPEALDAVIATALAKASADRFATALDLAVALRAASGQPSDDAVLPAFDETLRDAVLTAAPQPIADAVAAYEAATSPDRAARALAAIATVAVRYLGVVAIAARARSGGLPETPALAALIARWREHGLAIGEWIELCRLTCADFADRPDVFPVPELPLLFAPHPTRPSVLAEVAALDLDAIATALPAAIATIQRLLAELRFLSDYPLVAALDGSPRSWMGARRRRRAVARLAPGTVIEPGEPTLLDGVGAPIVGLFPLVQIAAPSPGAEDELFILERGHHLGAVLVAHPIGYERHDDRAWTLFGSLAGTAGPAATEIRERSPYRGLSSFDAGDADWFFGREREAEGFANRLREHAFIAVVGPSGVGKSSFIKAGVLPRLVDPHPIVFRPGERPLAAAAAALSAALGREVTAADLADPGALRDGALELAAAGGTTVIVVDQFEELVTLCRDPAEREQFGALLVEAGASVDVPVRVIVTLRDDFLVRAEEVPTLRHRLGRGLQLLTTPVASDLTRIVVEPARKAGYGFDDPELPARMVADVEARPGALALLSFTALRLWELRDERYRQLKSASYDAMGGVGGALARHAEATLAELGDAERPLVREAFRHLVTAEGTRAVLSKSELAEVLGKGDRAESVIQTLIGARLLASSEDASGDDRVEVVHEALLSAWPRLVDWRREDAETARLRDQLRAGARQWDDRGRAKGLLWRGEALVELSLWRARYPGKLTEREEAFAAASVADAARGRRIRRTLLGIAIGVLAIASAILLVMYRASQQDRRAAEQSRGEARDSATEARQRVVDLLSEQGRAAAVDGHPLEALVYLDAAHERGASGAALEYLVAGTAETLGLQRASFATHKSRVTAVAFSSDGSLLATAGGYFNRTVKVWDVATGALHGELAEVDGGASTIAFRPGGDELVVSAPPRTVVWDARRSTARYEVTDEAGPAGMAAMTPDGSRLLTITYGAPAKLRDGRTGALVHELASGPAVTAAISPSGKTIAVANTAGQVVVFSGDRGAEVARMKATDVWSIAIAPDDRTIVAALMVDPPKVMVWNRAGAVVSTITGHRKMVMSLDISADGEELLTASDDETAKLWRLDTGRLVTSFEGHTAPLVAARFAPDGRFVATSSLDGTAKLWLRHGGIEVTTFHGHTDQLIDLEFSPDGSLLATASIDKTARLWSTEIAGLIGEQAIVPAPASLSRFADGSVFAIGPGTPPTLRSSTGETLPLAVPQPLPPTEPVMLPIMERRRIASLASTGTSLAAPVGTDVVVWDRATGAILGTCRGHTAQVLSVRHSPDGRRVVSGDEAGAIRLCDLTTFESTPFASHEFAVLYAEFDPTGTAIVSAGLDKRVVVWNLRGEVERELAGHTNGVTCARFAPDGRRIVSSSLDTTVRIWDRATGDATTVLKAPVQITAVAFDDTVVAGAGEDGRLFLWETDDWRLVRAFGVRDGPIEWIDLAAGELVATDLIGRLRRWRIRRAGDLGSLHRYVACHVPYELVDNQPQLRPIQPDPACAAVTGTALLGR